jgi:hypothetical protein
LGKEFLGHCFSPILLKIDSWLFLDSSSEGYFYSFSFLFVGFKTITIELIIIAE